MYNIQNSSVHRLVPEFVLKLRKKHSFWEYFFCILLFTTVKIVMDINRNMEPKHVCFRQHVL